MSVNSIPRVKPDVVACVTVEEQMMVCVVESGISAPRLATAILSGSSMRSVHGNDTVVVEQKALWLIFSKLLISWLQLQVEMMGRAMEHSVSTLRPATTVFSWLWARYVHVGNSVATEGKAPWLSLSVGFDFIVDY